MNDEIKPGHMPTIRVLSILELISSSDQKYTMSDIARSLGIPTSTVFPILRTLRNEKYLGLDNDTQTYSLGTRLFEIGSRVQNTRIYKEITNILNGVVTACGETCHLGMLDGGDVFFLATVDSPQPIRMYCASSRRVPAYSTAIGKALLRGSSLDDLKRLYPEGLKPLTANTITDFEELYKQVNGNDIFSYESEESTESVSCISVPLYRQGAVIAASSVAVPIFRYDNAKKAQVEQALKEALIQFEHIIHLFVF